MKMRGRHRTEPAQAVAASDADDERLAGVLVAAGLVEPYQLDAARAAQDTGTLAEKLIAAGVVRDEAIARTLADHYECVLLDFRDVKPEAGGAGPAHPGAGADAARAAPRYSTGTRSRSPSSTRPRRGSRRSTAVVGRPVVPAVATHRDLDRAIDSAYRATRDVGSHVQAYEARDQLRREAAQLEAAGASEDAPVVRVVQMVITQGLRDRASDIHIEPSGDRVRVRYRIDGALTDVLDLPGSIGPAIVSRVKILGGMNIVERRRPQDGQISMDVEGREVDIRVATTAVIGGEKVVMRLLDKSRPLFKLEQLGMPPDARRPLLRADRARPTAW